MLFLLSLMTGVSSGVLVSIFLISLNKITLLRWTYPNLILGLPLVGIVVPLLYKKFSPPSTQRGLKFILNELRQPKHPISWTMTPLIYLTTLLSHLVGASLGREGTALQIAGSTADKLNHSITNLLVSKNWKHSLVDRQWILRIGLSGGFSAALGGPIAGTLFGLEVLQTTHWKKWNLKLALGCFLSSFTAWAITKQLHVPHFEFSSITPPEFSSSLLLHFLMLAFLIGMVSRLYTEGLFQSEAITHRIPEKWRGFWGGSILLALYFIFPLSPFQGLGLESINKAFTEPAPFKFPLLKFLLTIFSLSVGFKGGEFVPLVFIGSTLASSFAHLWQEPLGFFTSLGFVSLFGAATKTPLTCAFLTCELFGWQIAPYALLFTFCAYATAGPHGIYTVDKDLG